MEEAAKRYSVSAATVRRYAAAAGPDAALKLPIRPNGVKTRWVVEPLAFAVWSQGRAVRRSAPTPTGSRAEHRNTDTDPERTTRDTLRLAAVEEGLALLVAKVDRLEVLLVDDIRAARTAVLVEKGVAEELRTAQRAQQEAALARDEAFKLQVQGTQQALRAEQKQREAVEAMGRSLDHRSAQLDELLVPGSIPPCVAP